MIYAIRIIWNEQPFFLKAEDKTNERWETWAGGATRAYKDTTGDTYNTLNALHRKISTLNSPMAVYEPQEYNQ